VGQDNYINVCPRHNQNNLTINNPINTLWGQNNTSEANYRGLKTVGKKIKKVKNIRSRSSWASWSD
jgi:hypothetical protein